MHPLTAPILRSSVALVLLAVAACGGGGGGTPGLMGGSGPSEMQPETGTVFLWLGADKDATVSCGRPGDGCPDGNNNFGLHGFLTVEGRILGIQRIYTHFDLPTFPEGTVIEEAYFEMFHPAAREDGMTDDVKIPVTLANARWNPRTITWNNQPNPVTAGSINTINLNSQDWSGTGNIAGTVRSWLANPDGNHGLVTFWNTSMSPGIAKGFYSINDIRRRIDDLGPAPRLVMKITLPDGATTNDIVLSPFLQPDHDLPTQPGQAITMLEVSTGEGGNFPAAWDVKRGL